MHYPLHITLILASFWIFRGDVNALKSGLSSEVLTSFAKNVASVLSTTLLNDYQDPSSNQSSSNLLKRIQGTQSSLDHGHAQLEGSEISSKAPFGRYSRYTRDPSSSNEGKDTFQEAYITNAPRYSKYYDIDAYKAYEFPLNRDALISRNRVNAEVLENANPDSRVNSIDADVKAASLRYSNRYRHPPGLGYKPEPVHALPDSNRYAPFGLQPHYRHLSSRTPGDSVQPSANEGIPIDADGNGNPQVARITRRPYSLNYYGPDHASYYPPFHRHPEFYPHDRPIEGEGRPVAPANGQDESNQSRLIDDQNQGQSALGGYDYGPRFHHRPPYHDGFYHGGFPGFYPQPFNDSFYPGNVQQGGGNGTDGSSPFGPPIFHGPGFGPYGFGPYHQPFYPNFHGYGKPAEPQNPPENQGNPEQIAAPENGQADVNNTGHRPPFGYPPYYGGPYYGGFPFPAYPVGPFNGLPYRFGNGFHDHLFPRDKAVPHLNFYPSSYNHFPLGPWYPFGGYYPYGNHRPATTPGKPAEKTNNENGEAAGPAANGEVEMLSETKPETIRSLGLNRYGKRSFTGIAVKENNKAVRDQALI